MSVAKNAMVQVAPVASCVTVLEKTIMVRAVTIATVLAVYGVMHARATVTQNVLNVVARKIRPVQPAKDTGKAYTEKIVLNAKGKAELHKSVQYAKEADAHYPPSTKRSKKRCHHKIAQATISLML